jgi:hypothetical protein
MIFWFRFVRYEDIEDYEKLGWWVAATHVMPHARYGVIMQWLCACPMVEPQYQNAAEPPAAALPAAALSPSPVAAAGS